MVQRSVDRVIVAALAALSAQAVSAATLQVVPSASTVPPGGSVTIDVVVSGLGDMVAPSVGAFDLDLTFDDSLFTFTGASFGTLLGDELMAEAITGSMAAGGTLNAFEVSLLTPAQLVALQPDSFVLLSATFDALGPGTGTFSLAVNALGDENGAPLPIDALIDADVSVGTAFDIPTLSPVALLLLTLGLLGAAFHLSRRGRADVAFTVVVAVGLATLLAAAPLAAAVGDQDGDTDIDLDDVNTILAARGIVVVGPDPRDLDADGIITVLDARIAAACCTRPLCLVANNPPTAVDDTAMTGQSSTVNGDVTLNDFDPDMDPLTVSQVEGSAANVGVQIALPSGALLTVNANGTFTYDPNGQFDFLGPADTAMDAFTYQISDGNGGLDTATVTVTVMGGNDTPQIVDQGFAVDENVADGTSVGFVAASDPDAGQMLTFAILAGNTGNAFTLDPSTGELTVNAPPGLDFESIPQFMLTVQVTDDGAPMPLSNMATVTVDVNDLNEPPTITTGASFSVAENQTAVTDVDSTDPDGDTEGAGLSYTLTGGADLGAFSIVPGTGVLTFAAAPDFEAPTDAGGDNVYDVQVTVTDSGLLTDVQNLQVTVTGVNEPPTITAIADQMIDEDTTTGPLAFVIGDPETAPGSLMVSASSSNTTLIPNGNLTIGGVAPNLTIDVQPAMNQSGGPVTITVTVGDGALSTDELFDVTVNPVNDPPMGGADAFDFIGNTHLRVDLAPLPGVPLVGASTTGGVTPLADGLLDNDSDPVEMSAVSVSGVRDGAVDCGDVTPPFTDCPTANGGRVTVEANGQFSYTPLPGDPAPADSFQYRLSDGTDNVIVGVTLTRFDRAWYVDNSNGAPPSPIKGTSLDPFNTLAAAEAASLPADTIFVHEGDAMSTGQDAGIRLKPGQRLIGEGLDFLMNVGVNGNPAPTLVFDSAANNRPSVEHTTPANDGITVLADTADHNGIEIRGLALSGTGNAIDVTALATFAVGVTIADNLFVDSGAEAIDLNPGASGLFVATIENNTFQTTSATGNAIDVVTGAGAGNVEVAINDNVDITSSAGAGINVDGTLGTGTLFVTGLSNNAVHGNTGGTGVSVVGAVFDADPSDNDFDLVAAGVTSVGTPANPVGASGVRLGSPAAPQTRVSGNLSFAQLDVANAAGTGLGVAGSGPFMPGPPGAGLQLAVASGTVMSTGGPALDLDPLTANPVTLGQVVSSMSPTSGVSLIAVDGVVTLNNGGAGSLIAGATGTAFNVDGGTAAVTYNGVIDNASGFDVEVKNRPPLAGDVTFSNTIGNLAATTGQGILVDSNQAGVIAFTGAVNLNTGANAAVTLTNNAGATARFTGGLDVDTTTGIGFQATGGGSVEVLSGIVSTTVDVGAAAHAVDLNGVTIGAGNLTFDSITAASGTTAEALDLDNVASPGGFAAGAVTIDGNASTTTGIDVTGSSADFTFTGVTIDDTVGDGLNLDNNSGDVSVNGGSIGATTTTGGIAVDVAGGTGDVTVAGSITNGAGRAVEVTGRSTGSVIFQTGAITDTGGAGIRVASSSGGAVSFNGNVDVTNSTGAAITVESNTGGTTSFANLDVDNSTSNQPGIFATGNAGAHTLSTTTGTVDAGSSSAVDIDNTILGMTLVSVSSIGGAAVGIDIQDTTGSFTVTGDGAVGAGTSANNGSGGTIRTKTGDAVFLQNATNLSLSYLNIGQAGALGDVDGNGIRADNVNGFTLTRTNLRNVADQNAPDEAALHATEPRGTWNVLNNLFDRSFDDHFRVTNTGVAGTINVRDSTFQDNHVSTMGNDSILYIGNAGGSDVTWDIKGNAFTNSAGDAVQIALNGAASADVTIGGPTLATDRNDMTVNAGAAVLGGGITLSCGSGFSGTLTYLIQNNNIQDTNGQGINVDLCGTAAAGTRYTGTIDSNVIGTAGNLNSGGTAGIEVQTNGSGTSVVTVSNNVIREWDVDHGINIEARDGAGRIDITLTDNSVLQPSAVAEGPPSASSDAIGIAAGLVGGDTSVVCADIQNNTLNVNPEPTGWVSDVLFFVGGSGTLILPGYGGGANDGVAAAAFIAGNQADAPSALGFAFVPAQILGTGTSCP